MKRTTLLTVLAMLALSACDKKPTQEPFVPTPMSSSSDSLPAGHPPMAGADQAMTSNAPILQTQKATVVSTIDIPQFTYLEVKQNNQTRWLAASTLTAKKGDIVQFDEGSTMENFNSKALDRTFASITFVNRASIVKGK